MSYPVPQCFTCKDADPVCCRLALDRMDTDPCLDMMRNEELLMDKNVEIYCCYAHEDAKYLQMLKAQLSPFLHKGSILFWDDTNISPGALWQDEVNNHLETASIVLLLVSADFMNSEYCYSEEMTRAMQRHEEGMIRVIPIIIRPVAWQEAPFGNFQVLPPGSKAVSLWENIDQVLLDIVQGIAKVANEYLQKLYPDRAESFLKHDVSEQLAQIIQSFKLLRGQIASLVHLKGLKEFSIERFDNQYNKLYGNTLVFLAIYLSECVSDNPDGFVAIVHKKTDEELRRRGDVYVLFTRWVISPLAKLEKLAAQIDACTTTLEVYMQKYFGLYPHFENP
jgi:hypothetical protein